MSSWDSEETREKKRNSQQKRRGRHLQEEIEKKAQKRQRGEVADNYCSLVKESADNDSNLLGEFNEINEVAENDYYLIDKSNEKIKKSVTFNDNNMYYEDCSPYEEEDCFHYEEEDEVSIQEFPPPSLISELKILVTKESDPFLNGSLAASCELYPNSSMTQSTAVELIRDFINTSGLDKQNTNSLLTLLDKLLPTPNKLPLHYSKTGNLVSDLHSPASQTVFSVQCCPCAGYVYYGEECCRRYFCPYQIKKFNTKINARDSETCMISRWTPCKHCSLTGYCKHEDYRVPKMLLQYRPIVSIIIELLRQGENFLNILEYHYPDNGRGVGIYTDVMDSNVVQEQLTEMKSVYLNKYQGKETLVRMVNLTIAVNYDGAQIFHKKVSDFHPLMISILNLPPSYRKILGVGMFIVSLYTLKTSKCLFSIENLV